MREDFARLQAENSRLKLENTRLQERQHYLAADGQMVIQLPLPDSVTAEKIAANSPAAEKISLFKRLFRGRHDVYAVRWEYPDGRTGYAPASRSRSDRERGAFLPLTDEALQDHLNGRRTIGIYPLLRDDTCWFLAADFDKEHWQDNITSYLTACDKLGVPAVLERSRSGNGGHVWVFFDAPVVAAQARQLGTALLTLAVENRHEVGLDSYDRLFPSQDTLPKGGFGNLIALPLQGKPRQDGNSVFVDRDFCPYPDQWAYLSGVHRMRPEDLDRVVNTALQTQSLIGVRLSYTEPERDVDPWVAVPSSKQKEPRLPGPFPPSVRVTIADLAYVAKEGLSPAMLSRLWRRAAFQNPEFYRAQKMRLSTYGKPRIISCAEEFDRHIGLPRGCLDDVQELLATHDVSVDLIDERQTGRKIDVTFRGHLTASQQEAAEAILPYDSGLLCAPSAFGKTVVGTWLIAARQVNTLVLVHRKQLLDQWRERLSTFLDLPPSAIGRFSSGGKRLTGQIDVALMQSLCRDGDVDTVVADYGQVIVDECHHIPAFTFERVLKAAKARFIIGLTATPVRKDGHRPISVMQCGPLRFRVSAKDEIAARSFAQVVVPRPTAFSMPGGAHEPVIQEIYGALVTSKTRNSQICADILEAVQEGRAPLLLSERREHLDELLRMLEGRIQNIIVLHGGLGTKKRMEISAQLQSISAEEPCVILATGRYAGEGFDHPRLDTLLLALPISWRGTLRQYAGRIQREHPGKHEIRVYDYVDSNVPVLARMYEKRRN